jgi:transcriptional regulator with XRE-family HTH domain
MTDIGPELRALIIRARKDPARWHKPKGLSQPELASIVGVSAVWLRQIETGYTSTAAADTLGNICYVLRIKPSLIKRLGYPDVSAAMDAAVMLHTGRIPGHLLEDQEDDETITGLTVEEKEQLTDTLREIRRTRRRKTINQNEKIKTKLFQMR